MAYINGRRIVLHAVIENNEDNQRYFDITENGIVSLKPQYRGAFNANSYSFLHITLNDTDYQYAISDNGELNEGSKINVLPENLVVPQSINGVQVTGFQQSTFAFNNRIKYLTIPTTVTELPQSFCEYAKFIQSINGTENITDVDDYAFKMCVSLITINFPNLQTIGEECFYFDAHLSFAELGEITSLPDRTFNTCSNLNYVKANKCETVGTACFNRTRNLFTTNFFDNVTHFYPYSFIGSKTNEDFGALTATFDTNATHVQLNPIDIWTSVINGVDIRPDGTEHKYNECENRITNNFSQLDKRWFDYTFEGGANPDTGEIYIFHFTNCCWFLSIMAAYCGIKNITCTQPQELVELSRNALDIMWIYGDLFDADFANALGINAVVYGSRSIVSEPNPKYFEVWNEHGNNKFNQRDIRRIYDALSNGCYVMLTVPQIEPQNYDDINGHAVLAYGINEDGSLKILDSNNPSALGEDTTGLKYSAEINKLMSLSAARPARGPLYMIIGHPNNLLKRRTDYSDWTSVAGCYIKIDEDGVFCVKGQPTMALNFSILKNVPVITLQKDNIYTFCGLELPENENITILKTYSQTVDSNPDNYVDVPTTVFKAKNDFDFTSTFRNYIKYPIVKDKDYGTDEEYTKIFMYLYEGAYKYPTFIPYKEEE